MPQHKFVIYLFFFLSLSLSLSLSGVHAYTFPTYAKINWSHFAHLAHILESGGRITIHSVILHFLEYFFFFQIDDFEGCESKGGGWEEEEEEWWHKGAW